MFDCDLMLYKTLCRLSNSENSLLVFFFIYIIMTRSFFSTEVDQNLFLKLNEINIY